MVYIFSHIVEKVVCRNMVSGPVGMPCAPAYACCVPRTPQTLPQTQDMTEPESLKLLVDPKVVCLSRGCTSLAESVFQLLPLLEEIDLSGCESLTALPASLAGLASLQTLKLDRCSGLKALPELAGLASLRELDIAGCSGLEALPELAGLASLQTLNLDGCSGLSAEDKERAEAVVRANKEREQGH